MYTEHADNPEQLLMSADAALGKAIKEITNYAFYSQQDTFKNIRIYQLVKNWIMPLIIAN